ncbi:pyrroline-5-carboxylate reductase [Seleniivibrio sp.]|uniref:pyrroline-5-carboxylate reductase n=1 Tax=Seleniivibrio sp. TaxID=2898801 RepID=UPI0025DE5436|nr:pyrroline-5-carboxylate reductase [Seleniivibrio sp.]MCD8552796.1 pyrroline-5-carboxylate reductase [Seleniivibrio sp.]
MTETLKIGFIGAGNMAEAMIKGLLASDLKTEFAVSDSSVDRLEVIRTVYGIDGVAKDNKKVADFADIIVLAVKPQIISVVLRQLKGRVRDKLIVSIAAGITTEYIESFLGEDTRIVRVMPNTPALVLSGAAAICGGKAATDNDLATVKSMLDAVGSCIIVEESKIDAVTGLSGSGPAYVYQFIEALSDAGVKMGLMRADATLLAAQTVMGAAKMVIETKKHPGELKDGVTSPGGTTICGLHELEKGAMRATVMNAVEAAAEKSRELGKRK